MSININVELRKSIFLNKGNRQFINNNIANSQV